MLSKASVSVEVLSSDPLPSLVSILSGLSGDISVIEPERGWVPADSFMCTLHLCNNCCVSASGLLAALRASDRLSDMESFGSLLSSTSGSVATRASKADIRLSLWLGWG